MLKNKTPFFILVWLTFINLYGQIPGLTQFTTNNNLPSNTIYDIIQDDDGFMWFATDYGVSIFDGLTFKNYSVKDGLPGNEILFFYKDSKNRIWLSAFNGSIGFFNNGKFYNSNNTSYLKDLTFSRFVRDIYEDSKNNIYFYQGFNSIKKLKPDNSVDTINFYHNRLPKVSSSIIEDKDHNIHVLSHKKKGKYSYILTKKLKGSEKDSTWAEYNPELFLEESVKKINTNLGLFLSKISKAFSSCIRCANLGLETCGWF